MPPGLGKAIGDPANDDYVAQVLADEARNSSLKYPSLGTEAYMTRRCKDCPKDNMPEANNLSPQAYRLRAETEYAIPSSHNQGDRQSQHSAEKEGRTGS
jgi:hypothetical protein